MKKVSVLGYTGEKMGGEDGVRVKGWESLGSSAKP